MLSFTKRREFQTLNQVCLKPLAGSICAGLLVGACLQGQDLLAANAQAADGHAVELTLGDTRPTGVEVGSSPACSDFYDDYLVAYDAYLNSVLAAEAAYNAWQACEMGGEEPEEPEVDHSYIPQHSILEANSDA